MANQASNKIKYLLATGVVDFLNDTFKIALMGSGFIFNKDTHHSYTDISASELANGNGYTAGGATLAGVAVTEDDVDDRTEITWNNPSWTAAGGPIGPAAGAVIYDDTHVDKPIVGYIDFGSDYTQVDGGTATLASVQVTIS